MARFDLKKLRDIADEGIARHGLRGYARKLGLDVSTVRSLRDGRDMQVSKMLEIAAALGLSIEIRHAAGTGPQTRDDRHISLGYREGTAPQALRQGAPGGISPACHTAAKGAKAAHISFDPAWLTAQSWDLQCLRWIIAPRAADAICVAPGALCLLDCAQIWPDGHAVWAYLEDGALNIAYLNRPEPGTLLISGRDPAQRTRHLSGAALDAITPLGRVVWTETVLDGPQ